MFLAQGFVFLFFNVSLNLTGQLLWSDGWESVISFIYIYISKNYKYIYITAHIYIDVYIGKFYIYIKMYM